MIAVYTDNVKAVRLCGTGVQPSLLLQHSIVKSLYIQRKLVFVDKATMPTVTDLASIASP